MPRQASGRAAARPDLVGPLVPAGLGGPPTPEPLALGAEVVDTPGSESPSGARPSRPGRRAAPCLCVHGVGICFSVRRVLCPSGRPKERSEDKAGRSHSLSPACDALPQGRKGAIPSSSAHGAGAIASGDSPGRPWSGTLDPRASLRALALSRCGLRVGLPARRRL